MVHCAALHGVDLSHPSLVWLLVLAGCAESAEPCTVTQNDDGSATVACADGSSAIVSGGMDGDAGTDGTDGSAAVAALLRVDVEAAGSRCVDGGLAVHVGLDDDADGVLSDPEIDSTAYLCDGSDGEEGPAGSTTLIRFEELEAGDACSQGGTAIHAGIDDDGDGYLDDVEISDTVYLCGEESAVSSVEVEFPSPDTETPRGTLGAGDSFFSFGSYVTETFRGTGLSNVTGLELEFTMDDATTSLCTVGTLSWDVIVNDATVGTYDYACGYGRGTLEFSERYAFDAVEGGGADGESYEISFMATTTVSDGGGGWTWYPGGSALFSR